jgi:hypothetical protein
MYAWFNRHLDICDDPDRASIADVYAGKLSENSPYRERPIQFLNRSELTVWNDEHPTPESGMDEERNVTRYWSSQQQQAVKVLRETNPDELKGVMRCLLNFQPGNPADDALQLEALPSDGEQANGVRETSYSLKCRRENLPFKFKTWFAPIPVAGEGGREDAPGKYLIILCQPIEPNEAYETLRKQLLLAGHDLMEVESSQLHLENKLVPNGREAAGYTFGYNRSNLARNARAVAWVIDHFGSEQDRPVVILETDRSQPALLAGAAAAETAVHAMILKGAHSFADTTQLTDPNFLPGAMLVGDSAGMKRIAGLDDAHCPIVDDRESITAAAVQRLMDEMSMKIP